MIRGLQAQIWGLGGQPLPHRHSFQVTLAACTRVVRSREADRCVPVWLLQVRRPAAAASLFEGSTATGGWVAGAGVHPDLRGRGVATILKTQQAELARQAGIDIVNWTADPLLWPNAVLNFGRLGAVAFDFVPGMYAFRNAMNRVPASRLALTWLVSSQRVRDHLRAPAGVSDLAARQARSWSTRAGRQSIWRAARRGSRLDSQRLGRVASAVAGRGGGMA